MLGRVNNALLRVQAAEQRAELEDQIERLRMGLEASKATLKDLIAKQRAQPWGRGIASLRAEELAAAAVVGEAVEAFGSQRQAADSLGLSARVVADYVALLRERAGEDG